MHDVPVSPTAASDLKWLVKWYLGFLYKYLFNKHFTPPTLNFLVTLRCDLRCRHCFLWERLEDPREARELSLEEIQGMARTMDPLFSLVLSGGEPFLRRDLAQIARIFHEHTRVKVLTILTDGQMPQRIQKVTTEILNLCPEIVIAIGVSLDGIGERHDQIRQKAGAFEKAIETVLMLKDLSQKEPRLSVQTCTVLMAFNEDHIFDLYTFLRDELRPDRIAVNLIRQDTRDPQAKAVDPEIYGRLTRLIREDTFSGRLRNRFSFDRFAFLTVADLSMMEKIHKTLLQNRPQIRCRAGSVSGVVFPDGAVFPCEMKPSWGNLQETAFDFSRFWSIQRRRALERGNLPGPGCFCTHEINCFLPSIPFNPRLYLRLLFQWIRVIFGQVFKRDRTREEEC